MTETKKMEVARKHTRTDYTVRVPAGTYFLGDPGYAVPDHLWMFLLESCGTFGAEPDEPNAGPVGEVEGFTVLGFGTAYGDGVYVDQYGNEYPVDAGMIGLVPEALARQAEGYRSGKIYGTGLGSDRVLGRFVTFDSDVLATDDGEGRMRFGRYRIDTTDEDD